LLFIYFNKVAAFLYVDPSTSSVIPSQIKLAMGWAMAGPRRRLPDAVACVNLASRHNGKAITVWYIEGEDGVEVVEYKV
jgi:hypothetical protein